MKVKQLLKFLQEELTEEDLEKEIGFYDEKNRIMYDSPNKPTFVDLSDDKYLDFSFNLTDEQIEYFAEMDKLQKQEVKE